MQESIAGAPVGFYMSIPDMYCKRCTRVRQKHAKECDDCTSAQPIMRCCRLHAASVGYFEPSQVALASRVPQGNRRRVVERPNAGNAYGFWLTGSQKPNCRLFSHVTLNTL